MNLNLCKLEVLVTEARQGQRYISRIRRNSPRSGSGQNQTSDHRAACNSIHCSVLTESQTWCCIHPMPQGPGQPGADSWVKSDCPMSPRAMEEGAILRDYAFLTGDCVPHAGATQRVHTFHDDKRGLLQRYNTQMVILLLLRLRTHSGPHVVLHLQGLVFPLSHLHRDKQKTQKPVSETQQLLLASPRKLWNKGQWMQALYMLEKRILFKP